VTSPIIIYQGTNDTTVPRIATNTLVASAQQKETIFNMLLMMEMTKWIIPHRLCENIDDIVKMSKLCMPNHNALSQIAHVYHMSHFYLKLSKVHSV
jgi:hypothetical protein